MATDGNIGRELVLWHTEYTPKAYTDQFGKSHDGYFVREEFHVKIIEVRPVHNMWGGGFSEGWRALTSKGREFTCNWDVFPDDSGTPTYFWHFDDFQGIDYMSIVDAEQAINGGMVFAYPDGTKAIPEGFDCCEKHNIWHKEKEECWKCEYIDKKKESSNV